MGWVRNTAFVIMPFVSDPQAKDNYEAIRDECAKLNVKTTRADKIAGGGNVNEDIASSIWKSEFIVCDLSQERPNVYYELGFAHGAGHPPSDILLLAREKTNLHFNIATLRVKYFRDVAGLRKHIKQDLREMIRKRRENDPGKELKGKIGDNAASASAWIPLSRPCTFRKDEYLRIFLRERRFKRDVAEKVIVRLLINEKEADKPVGIITEEGLFVPDDGVVEIAIPRTFRNVCTVSIHGGPNPFKQFDLGKNNGRPILEKLELLDASPKR